MTYQQLLQLTVFSLLAVMFACSANSGGGNEAPRWRLAPIELVVGTQGSWTGAESGEPSIASVNGIPIPAGRLARAISDSGEGEDPRNLLRSIVAEEVLAQTAIHRDSFRSGFLNATLARTLVSRLIQDRFVEHFGPADIPKEEIEKLFKIPAVSGRFDHLDIYEVQDYQWICCNAKANDCTTPEAIACFAEGGAAMEAVFEYLEELSPESDDLPLIIDELKKSAPRLSYQEYEFAFDRDSGKQKGSIWFDDDIVAAIVTTGKGHFSEPVQSAFGWHLPFVKDMLPEVHKDLSYPEVVEEISEFFHPRFQQKEFLDFLGRLIPIKKFEFLAPMYRGWKASVEPAYPVAFFPDALKTMDRPDDEIEGL